jgi:hypothetical protein
MNVAFQPVYPLFNISATIFMATSEEIHRANRKRPTDGWPF